jgi:hemophore-related protein
MLNVSWTRSFLWKSVVIAAGAIALSLTSGGAVASADPDLGPVVNTTCTYPQAVAAMNDQAPAAAQQFSASPLAQSWLRSFLAAPADRRQRMVQQVQSLPAFQQYVGVVQQVAGVCSNY